MGNALGIAVFKSCFHFVERKDRLAQCLMKPSGISAADHVGEFLGFQSHLRVNDFQQATELLFGGKFARQFTFAAKELIHARILAQ